MRFETGTYSGTGSAQNITVTFQPAVLLILSPRTGADTALNSMVFLTAEYLADSINYKYDTTASADNTITSSAGISAWSSSSFTVNTSVLVNKSGSTYRWYNFGVDTAALVTGKYTGNATDNRNISTGGSFTPSFVCVLQGASEVTRLAPIVWYGTKGGDNSFRSEAGGTPIADQIQTVGSGTFQVGSGTFTNVNTNSYYFFAIVNSTGNLFQGNYTGDGADPQTITQSDAFQPVMVWINGRESSANARGVINPGFATGDNSFVTAFAGDQVDHIQSLTSSGFTVGGSGNVNFNTNPYHYLSIKNLTSPDVVIPHLISHMPTLVDHWRTYEIVSSGNASS